MDGTNSLTEEFSGHESRDAVLELHLAVEEGELLVTHVHRPVEPVTGAVHVVQILLRPKPRTTIIHYHQLTYLPTLPTL